MTKKELKKWLKRCGSNDRLCDGCPFKEHTSCFAEIKLAALALIKKQEKEINQLKTECALLDDELRIARQDTIDVLNKVKERACGLAAIETYHICNLIDELLKEYEK